MTLASALPWLLGTMALLAMWRAFVRGRAEAWPAWRRVAVLALQPVLALLLGLALLPPARPGTPVTLVLLTAGASAPATQAPGEHVLALPEAGAPGGVDRVPDLASALRRHPAATRLRVLGEGLPARDHDAARALPLAFEPGEPPTGLVGLHWPTRVLAGARFEVRGRIAGTSPARLELRDPAGRRVALATPDDEGHFVLAGEAGDPGPMAFELRVLGDGDAVREQLALPLRATAGAPHRLWLIAGAPGPELRQLRRWAVDAGLELHSQMALGAGITIGDGARPVTAATLAETDLLVLDERAWRALGPRGRQTVVAAIAEGLGVLVRITGPLSAAERGALREQGLLLEAGDRSRAVVLPPALTPEAPADQVVPTLARWPDSLAAPGGGVLLADANGDTLGAWQAIGRGRLGVWLLSDSFRWAQAGYPQAHARLWADAVATLARPRVKAGLALPEYGQAGERAALCGLDEGAELIAPDGSRTPLLPDPATGDAACAAAWPTRDGWHRVRSGEHELDWPVLPADALPGLHAQARREATLRLAAFAPEAATDPTPPDVPGPRWPWFLAWLAATALAWTLERRGTEVISPEKPPRPAKPRG